MSYAQQQRDPRRHLFGIGSVVLIHIVVVYALLNGLARKVVEVFKKPLEVSIVEEVKLPPPPAPPKVLRPQPRPTATPPPAYVPPPEVAVATPAPNVVSAVTQAPPPPPPAPAVEAPRPAVVAVGIACPNHAEVRSRVPYPAQAMRLGLSGEVEIEFSVSPTGGVGEISVARSSNKIFNSAATAAVAQLHCSGQGQTVRVRVPFVFRLDA